MPEKFIVFDLDGTISNPKDGIVRSLNYALEAYDFEKRAESELTPCIGPPLDQSFRELTGSDDQQLIVSLVEKYRERYTEVGFSENVLYEGIVDSLEALVACFPLAICTSKRVDFAHSILELFELTHLFQEVSGGDIGISKTQQLAGLLERKVIDGQSIMVGDRYADMIGARENQLGAIGVLWGFGDFNELQRESPMMIIEHPSELPLRITE
ncbi:MAG: HAD hydrolase-like protein [Pseudomonadales bacterium]